MMKILKNQMIRVNSFEGCIQNIQIIPIEIFIYDIILQQQKWLVIKLDDKGIYFIIYVR